MEKELREMREVINNCRSLLRDHVLSHHGRRTAQNEIQRTARALENVEASLRAGDRDEAHYAYSRWAGEGGW